MITCDNARQLFDRYLDGELTSGMQAEIHAHRLNCSSCQNDLAILEACGDVIGMDESEPLPSSDFTNSVMMAYRAQRKPKLIRFPRAAMMWAGGSLAAAASIALVFVSLTPKPDAPQESVIAADMEAAPKVVQTALIANRKTQRTDAEMQELEAIPQMRSAEFMDSLLEPVVDKAQHSFENARIGVKQLQVALDLGWTNTSDRLSGQPEENVEQNSHNRFDDFAPLTEPSDTAIIESSNVDTPELAEAL